MRTFTVIFAMLLLAVGASDGAEEIYPLRDAKDGEGRPSWWWEVFYHPVVVVRGTLAATQKDRPDLLIHGTYDAWSKLTAPSLANQPTEQNFYLLLTRLKVTEVLYVDPTLLHVDAAINWLADRKKDQFDCILPARLAAAGERGDFNSGEPKPDKNGRYSYVYKLSLPGGGDVPAAKEFILIFEYVSLYPIQGLHLTAFTEVTNLKQVRSISDYRRKRQPKP